MINIVGLLCLMRIISIIYKALINNRVSGLIFNPELYLNLMYFKFWGIRYGDFDFYEEFILTFSYILLTFVYWLTANNKTLKCRYLNFVSVFNIYHLSRKSLLVILCLYLFYVGLDWFIYSQAFNSLEKALVRFYASTPLNETSSYLVTILNTLSKLLLGLLFIIRLSVLRSKSGYTVFYICLICMLITAFSRGTRGAIVAVFFMPCLADLFYIKDKRYYIIHLFKDRFILFCTISAVFFFLFMSRIRSVEFEGFSELYEYISDNRNSISEDDSKFNENKMIYTDYQLSLSYFDVNASLPFHYSLIAILSNPIPRVLYKDKPVGYGVVLTEIKQGNNNFTSQNLIKHRASFAAGIAGEAWANNGIFGVLFYSLIWGVYGGFLARNSVILLRKNDLVSMILGLIFFQSSYNFVRGDMLSAFSQGVYPIIMLLLLIYIASVLKRCKI